MTQQSETEGLKPCPLAHQVVNGLNISSSNGMRKWHLTCFDCGLVFEGQLDETARSLFNRWNTRAPVDSQGAGDDTRSLLRKLKDFLFDNCDHADRDRNYDWCPKCVMAFVKVLARPSECDAATQMRDAWVEKVRETAKTYRRLRKDNANIIARHLDTVAVKLESLTLDQVKRKEQSK